MSEIIGHNAGIQPRQQPVGKWEPTAEAIRTQAATLEQGEELGWECGDADTAFKVKGALKQRTYGLNAEVRGSVLHVWKVRQGLAGAGKEE